MPNQCPKNNKTLLSQVIRQVVKEFSEHPYDINDGRCDEFAEVVIERVPGAVFRDLGLEWGHCVIEFDGRYYDAEEPEGVLHWRQLPLCVRAIRANREMRVKQKKSPDQQLGVRKAR